MEQPSRNNANEPGAPSSVSLLEFANVLLRHRRMIVLLPVLTALLLGGAALLQDRSYSASASFLPQGAMGASGGAAATVARQFGVDLTPARAGESPDFYVHLLQGREILRQAVESEYTVLAEGERRVGTLVEIWAIEEDGLTPRWRVAVERLRQQASVSVDRQTGVVDLAVSADSPELAEQIATRLLELLSQFNLEVRQTQAREEGEFVNARLQEAQADLRAAEEALQEFLQSNREFQNSPTLLFEHDRLQRQVRLRQELVNSLALSLEQARIEQVRNTPVLTVVADPMGSAAPVARGTVARALLGLFLGGVLAVLIAFAREFGRRSRAEEPHHYREFDELKREAVADLRHPHRVLASLLPRRRA